MSSHTPDRRAALRLGAAAAVAAAVPAAAAAQNPANRLPDLYRGINAKQFQAIRDHEAAHVSAIVDTLGSAARPKPTFRNLLQPDVRTFGDVSQTLENTGVGAYLGAAPAIFSRKVLASAASIALIEARHSAYLNVLFNDVLTTDVKGQVRTIEQPLTIAEVVNLAGPFIADLNGGPPLTFNADAPSRANDVLILNFALALEYLEAEFYAVNVPRFFPAT